MCLIQFLSIAFLKKVDLVMYQPFKVGGATCMWVEHVVFCENIQIVYIYVTCQAKTHLICYYAIYKKT